MRILVLRPSFTRTIRVSPARVGRDLRSCFSWQCTCGHGRAHGDACKDTNVLCVRCAVRAAARLRLRPPVPHPLPRPGRCFIPGSPCCACVGSVRSTASLSLQVSISHVAPCLCTQPAAPHTAQPPIPSPAQPPAASAALSSHPPSTQVRVYACQLPAFCPPGFSPSDNALFNLLNEKQCSSARPASSTADSQCSCCRVQPIAARTALSPTLASPQVRLAMSRPSAACSLHTICQLHCVALSIPCRCASRINKPN